MLLIAVPFIVIIVLRETAYKMLAKYGFTLTSHEIVVDENLPNFFEAVKLADADWMVFENMNLRKNYGFNFIPQTVEETLDEW